MHSIQPLLQGPPLAFHATQRIASGALGPLPGAGGEHVAVAGALVDAAARPRGHAVALLAAEAAGPHAPAPRPRARRAAAPHAALARAEPCMHHAVPVGHVTVRQGWIDHEPATEHGRPAGRRRETRSRIVTSEGRSAYLRRRRRSGATTRPPRAAGGGAPQRHGEGAWWPSPTLAAAAGRHLMKRSGCSCVCEAVLALGE